MQNITRIFISIVVGALMLSACSSIDCAPAVFHTIEGVRFTQHAIEDIKINNNKVTYNDPKAHLLIYIKNSNN